MSFKLVRHKNGQEVPIKVSVLDVFRTGSRKHASASGGQINRIRSHPQPSAQANRPELKGAAKLSNGHPTSEIEVWTPEDDAKLIEMKTDGNTWREILAALGDTHKSDSQMRARYREIAPKKEDDKKKEDEKKAKAEKDKAEGTEKTAGRRETKEKGRGKGNVGDGGEGGIGGKKQNVHQPKTTEPLDQVTKDMKAFVANFEKAKWVAAASRHYDRTGQRISPEMAKGIFGN